MALPDFVSPMLALRGEPFDSEEHLFEIKWDGIRALCFAEGGALRLRSRTKRELSPRFPELAFLAQLPSGTLLDGELVLLEDGRPDFHKLMSREHARGERTIASLAARSPVSYVAFDVLYAGGQAVTDRPLLERKELLAGIVAAQGEPLLVASEAMPGSGLEIFEGVRRLGLEGLVAKRRDSRYESGRRTGAWTKIKAERELDCVIVGYLPEGTDEVKSLWIAAAFDGTLEPVGRVGSGLTQELRRELRQRLEPLRRDEPLVPCGPEGVWVEPAVFCTVSYLERTGGGGLRAPVFRALVEDDDPEDKAG